MRNERSGRGDRGRHRFAVGLLLGIALGASVVWIWGETAWQAWERVLPGRSGAEEKTRAVEKVIDGDTIVVDRGERVRILGLDAPEIGEPFYEQAKAFLEKTLPGSRVRLMPCKEEARDSYGRTLAFLHKRDVDVGAMLIRQGLARTLFVGPCGRSVARDYRKLEREAFREGRGLWSLQEPRQVSHSEAGRYIGCLARVTGKVLKVHQGPRAFHLNFGPDYRTDFTAVVFRKDLSRLAEEGLRPVTAYQGQFVEVTGMIDDYNGPEIIIESADQLTSPP